MNDVKPALNAQEWRGDSSIPFDEPSIHRRPEWSAGISRSGNLHTASIPNREERHALAALALHQQPFGFTREDVRLVEFIATFDPQTHPDVPKLRSLAARISALLPPETP